MKQRFKRYLQFTAAWLLVLVGIVLLLSPIPIGLFIIAVGLSLLIYSSEAVQLKIHRYRERHPDFCEKMCWIETKLENRIHFISQSLRKTRPIRFKDE